MPPGDAQRSAHRRVTTRAFHATAAFLFLRTLRIAVRLPTPSHRGLATLLHAARALHHACLPCLCRTHLPAPLSGRDVEDASGTRVRAYSRCCACPWLRARATILAAAPWTFAISSTTTCPIPLLPTTFLTRFTGITYHTTCRLPPTFSPLAPILSSPLPYHLYAACAARAPVPRIFPALEHPLVNYLFTLTALPFFSTTRAGITGLFLASLNNILPHPYHQMPYKHVLRTLISRAPYPSACEPTSFFHLRAAPSARPARLRALRRAITRRHAFLQLAPSIPVHFLCCHGLRRHSRHWPGVACICRPYI